MKKIAMIRRSFRADGGGETAFEQFLMAYLNLGYDVTVICESWHGNFPHSVKFKKLRLVGGRTIKLWLFWFGVNREIAKGRFDLVHSHEFVSFADVLRLGDGLHSDWVQYLSQSRGLIGSLGVKFSIFHVSKCLMERVALSQQNRPKLILNSPT